MLFLFELLHTFSHIIHLPGKIQNTVIHIIGVITNICLIYTFYKSTHVIPSNLFIAFIIIIELLDIYFFIYLPFLFSVFTQFIIITSTFLYYKTNVSIKLQRKIPYIIGIIILIVLAVINEKFNCKQLLTMYPNVPFHMLVEFLGTISFCIILSFLYEL